MNETIRLQNKGMKGNFIGVTSALIFVDFIVVSTTRGLMLKSCDQITDASIKSISVNCTGLQSVNLERYYQLSDASIIYISENCTGLNELYISHTNITDTSLTVIA